MRLTISRPIAQTIIPFKTVVAACAMLSALMLAVLFVTPGTANAARCGADGQRPCKVFERIPSCNKGLIEDFGAKKCRRKKVKVLNCGRENQRACKVTERIPSCNKGLKESRGRCVELGEGEIPFFATIGEASRDIAAIGERECIRLLDRLPVPNVNIGVRLPTQETKYFIIGHDCAIMQNLDQLSGATSLINEMNRQHGRRPCSDLPQPGRLACSLHMSTAATATGAVKCAVTLAKEKLIEPKGGGGSLRDTWLGIGRMSYTVSNLALSIGKGVKNRKKGKKKKGPHGEPVPAFLDYLLDASRLQIKYTAKARGVLEGPACRNV